MTDAGERAHDAPLATAGLDLSGAAPLAPAHRAWLNEIAIASAGPFNALVERLGAPHGDDIDWWVTPVAARNVYASALFLRICKLRLALRIVDGGSRVDEIVVDTPGLAAALHDALARRGSPVRVRARAGAVSFRVRLAGGMAYRMAAALFQTINQALCARLTRGGARAPEGPITLIDTFVYRDSFESAYGDRHYPGLLEHLTESERRGIYFLPGYYKVRNYLRLFRGMRASTANFIVKEDFLRLSDYGRALSHPFRALRFRVRAAAFEDVDVAPLVNEALAEAFASSGTIEGLLRYRLAARLRARGLALRMAIDWFENQEIDHGSNAGLRRAFPDTPVVGYQGFVVSRHYLSTFPTAEEMRLGLIPHRVAVTGPALVARAQAFCPGLAVEPAPAFRFAGVWREPRAREDTKSFRILAALPLMRDESAEILDLIAEAARAFPGPGGEKPWRVRVKAHPSFASALPAGFEKAEGDLDDAINDCDVVVSAASSACVQALAHGVPVVALGAARGLTFNPIPEDFDPDMWSVCYGAPELVAALKRYAAREPATIARHRASGLALRERLFSPVTRASTLRFLRLGPQA